MGVYGYIRKNEEARLMDQLQLVQQFSCDDIYIEEADFQTSVELERLLESLKACGNTLVVCNLLSFGKGIKQLRTLFETLVEKNIRLISVEDEIDTENANQDFYQIVLLLSEMDHKYHSAHTQRGLDRASEQGIRGGRPTISPEKVAHIQFLHHEKNFSIRDIARQCSVSVGTVHKYLKLQSML